MRIEVTDEPVILTGPNGSGKTNILEALSLLIPGRGLRQARLSNLSRSNGDGNWGVTADLITPKGKISIGTGNSPPKMRGERESRVVKLNGIKKINQNLLSTYMSAIWLTPQMDTLFNGPAVGRRRFFDSLVASSDPLHQGRINAFKTKMKERLLLLGKNAQPDIQWISALESIMTEQGVAISAARIEFLSRIGPIAAKGLDLFPGANLSLIGELETRLQNSPAIQVEDWFKNALKKNRSLDLNSGKTTLGPHRTDLLVYHRPKKQAAALCSTGEQKALLVAIILAHAQLRKITTGSVPLLLLDEITAHLDEGRREALFSNLEELSGQVWFTGTDKNLFKTISSSAQMLRVENGRVLIN